MEKVQEKENTPDAVRAERLAGIGEHDDENSVPWNIET